MVPILPVPMYFSQIYVHHSIIQPKCKYVIFMFHIIIIINKILNNIFPITKPLYTVQDYWFMCSLGSWQTHLFSMCC